MIARVPTRFRTVCDLCRRQLDSIVWSRRLISDMSSAVHGYGPHICLECRK